MATACRVDELYQSVPTGATDSGRGGMLADYAFPIRQETRFLTGLRGAPMILADQAELPDAVWAAVDQFKVLEALGPGWDTYSGQPVDKRVVRPALNLVLESLHVCMPPRITASKDGGVILLWENNDSELELEVKTNGSIEAYYRNDESGEEEEPDTPLSFFEASALIKKIRSAHHE